jgi:hypothetical protein
MTDKIRNDDSKTRVVRLLGHRDDAGAWQIRDFLKRSVIEFRWIELSTEEDCRRELGLSDLGRAPPLDQAGRHRSGRGRDGNRLCS